MVKGPEQMRFDNMWDACINQPRNKQKGEIAHAYGRQDTRKQQCLSQRSNKHCLSRRPEGYCLSQRRDNTASRRGGKENKEKPNCCFHIAGHGIPSSSFASVGRLKPNAENRDAFQLTRNSLDTFHPRDKRCHACRDVTAARCDHRATRYT